MAIPFLIFFIPSFIYLSGFALPFVFYLLFYGFQQKNRCPICFNAIRPIDYNYPPFRGSHDSFDPGLIALGKVLRTEGSNFNPEGDFVEFVETNMESRGVESQKKTKFCKKCHQEIKFDINFCHMCGDKL